MRIKFNKLLKKKPKEVFAFTLFTLLVSVIIANYISFLPFFIFIFALGFLVGLVTP